MDGLEKDGPLEWHSIPNAPKNVTLGERFRIDLDAAHQVWLYNRV
jgi:hypothetical protein